MVDFSATSHYNTPIMAQNMQKTPQKHVKDQKQHPRTFADELQAHEAEVRAMVSKPVTVDTELKPARIYDTLTPTADSDDTTNAANAANAAGEIDTEIIVQDNIPMTEGPVLDNESSSSDQPTTIHHHRPPQRRQLHRPTPKDTRQLPPQPQPQPGQPGQPGQPLQPQLQSPEHRSPEQIKTQRQLHTAFTPELNVPVSMRKSIEAKAAKEARALANRFPPITLYTDAGYEIVREIFMSNMNREETRNFSRAYLDPESAPTAFARKRRITRRLYLMNRLQYFRSQGFIRDDEIWEAEKAERLRERTARYERSVAAAMSKPLPNRNPIEYAAVNEEKVRNARRKPFPTAGGWPRGLAACWYTLFRQNHVAHPSQKKTDEDLAASIRELFPGRKGNISYSTPHWRRRINVGFFKYIPAPPPGGFVRYLRGPSCGQNTEVWIATSHGKAVERINPRSGRQHE